MPYNVALLASDESVIETNPGTVALTCDSEQGSCPDGEQTDGEEPESAYTLATYAALGASTLLF